MFYFNGIIIIFNKYKTLIMLINYYDIFITLIIKKRIK